MPELPEVETVVRTLRPMMVGRKISAVRFGRKRLRRGGPIQWAKALPPAKVVAMRRRGKWIIIELDRAALLVHLGMTGQLTFGPADRPMAKHTHFVADLDHDQLRFRDARRFGSVNHFASEEELEAFLNDRLGPEPFDLKPAAWRKELQQSRRAIKAVLLDQKVVAGVGNIYADESLFLARVHPAEPANRMDAPAANRLRAALTKVLSFAIERRGSSIRDYLDGAGEPGEYQSEFRVYGRFGAPCPRCKAAISRIRLAGRSTHFCPRCQQAAGRPLP